MKSIPVTLMTIIAIWTFALAAAEKIPDDEIFESPPIDESSTEPTDEQKKFTAALQIELRKLKGFKHPSKDFFLVGEAKGRAARFFVVQGMEATTSLITQIVSESPDSQWRVFGRADTQERGMRMINVVRREFIANNKPRFA